MADADDVRRLALALPHVEEIDSDGFDFRVGGKGFVWSYPERQPGRPRVLRTDIAVLYVGDEAEKQRDLVVLRELAEASALVPVVGACYPLDRIADAYRHVDAGHKKGTIVVTVS